MKTKSIAGNVFKFAPCGNHRFPSLHILKSGKTYASIQITDGRCKK